MVSSHSLTNFQVTETEVSFSRRAQQLDADSTARIIPHVTGIVLGSKLSHTNPIIMKQTNQTQK